MFASYEERKIFIFVFANKSISKITSRTRVGLKCKPNKFYSSQNNHNLRDKNIFRHTLHKNPDSQPATLEKTNNENRKLLDSEKTKLSNSITILLMNCGIRHSLILFPPVTLWFHTAPYWLFVVKQMVDIKSRLQTFFSLRLGKCHRPSVFLLKKVCKNTFHKNGKSKHTLTLKPLKKIKQTFRTSSTKPCLI